MYFRLDGGSTGQPALRRRVHPRKAVKNRPLLPDSVATRILIARGRKVVLDTDLAELYGVPAKALNQAVRRNRDRFPEDFMFQLSWDELESLRSRTVTLNGAAPAKRGAHVKYRPHAFTEQGVAMLSSVLRSKRAVQVNIEIMRAFVRLRVLLASNAELARKLAALENRYDAQFKIVFHAIRELMTPPEPKPGRRIGFVSDD